MEVEDLEAQGFKLLDELDHKQLVPFIRTYLAKPVPARWLYLVVNIVPITVAGAWCGWLYSNDLTDIDAMISRFGIGFALALLLVPLHEYLHVLAYRSQGAINTSYGADIKRFLFMALADRFVADRRAFRVVALAPFITITLLLTLGLLFTPPKMQMVLLGTLIVHTACCSGDFGLLAYFDHHRDKEVVTYDDVAAKRSYFLARGLVRQAERLKAT